MFRNLFIVLVMITSQSVFASTDHNSTRSTHSSIIADITSDQVEEYSYDLRKESGEGFASGEFLRKMEDMSFTVEMNKTLAGFGLLSNLIEQNLEKMKCQNRRDFKECVAEVISISEEEAMKIAIKARRGGGGGIKIGIKTKM